MLRRSLAQKTLGWLRSFLVKVSGHVCDWPGHDVLLVGSENDSFTVPCGCEMTYVASGSEGVMAQDYPLKDRPLGYSGAVPHAIFGYMFAVPPGWTAPAASVVKSLFRQDEGAHIQIEVTEGIDKTHTIEVTCQGKQLLYHRGLISGSEVEAVEFALGTAFERLGFTVKRGEIYG